MPLVSVLRKFLAAICPGATGHRRCPAPERSTPSFPAYDPTTDDSAHAPDPPLERRRTHLRIGIGRRGHHRGIRHPARPAAAETAVDGHDALVLRRQGRPAGGGAVHREGEAVRDGGEGCPRGYHAQHLHPSGLESRPVARFRSSSAAAVVGDGTLLYVPAYIPRDTWKE